MSHAPLPVVLLALLGLCNAQDKVPPVFDARPYAAAKKAAQDAGKWFVAKATASWCAPCKLMDETTWRDEKVVKWLTDNAIVVAFDVDEHKQLATDLAVASMPTMIAFKGGREEFDRITGYQKPAEFLAWLTGIAKGERAIDAVRKRAGDRADPQGKVDVQARMELAKSLIGSGKLEEATDELAWLWEHMLEHNPAFVGVRVSFMASDMERLAARSPAAKQRFTELRDRARKQLDADAVDPMDVSDWVTLNKIVGDKAATLAWFDEVKDEPRKRELVMMASRELFELLVAAKRWPDIGKLYKKPITVLEAEHKLAAMMPIPKAVAGLDAEFRKRMIEMPAAQFREKAARIYAGLLAAERGGDAEVFAARARELDPAEAMLRALVATALDAGQPRKQHLEWLDAAGTAALGELRNSVSAALAK